MALDALHAPQAAGASAVGSVAGGLESVARSATDQADDGDVVDYFVDRVFRTDSQAGATDPAAGTPSGGSTGEPQNDEGFRLEAVGIFAESLRQGELDDDNADYLAQLVAQHTDLSPQEARSRVDEAHSTLVEQLEQGETRARELADEAREATAYASLWLFIAMLMGASFASLMATFGGRQRDQV